MSNQFNEITPLERTFGKKDYELATYLPSQYKERCFPDYLIHYSDDRNTDASKPIVWTKSPDDYYVDKADEELIRRVEEQTKWDHDSLGRLKYEIDELDLSDYIFAISSAIVCIVASPFIIIRALYHKLSGFKSKPNL